MTEGKVQRLGDYIAGLSEQDLAQIRELGGLEAWAHHAFSGDLPRWQIPTEVLKQMKEEGFDMEGTGADGNKYLDTADKGLGTNKGFRRGSW